MKSTIIQIGQNSIPVIYIDVAASQDRAGGRFFCTALFVSYFRNHNAVFPVGPTDSSELTSAYSRVVVDAMTNANRHNWPLNSLISSARPCTDAQVAGAS